MKIIKNMITKIITLTAAIAVIAGAFSGYVYAGDDEESTKEAFVITEAYTTFIDNNISQNYYMEGAWDSPDQSYIYINESGGITTVELNSDDGSEIIENYTADFEYIDTIEIEEELSTAWLFLHGEDYNFLVFTENNSHEDPDKEVIRVVKYSHDWERLDSCSLYGDSTNLGSSICFYNFYYGNGAIYEDNGILYIRLPYEDFNVGGEGNHQGSANIFVEIDDMTPSVNSDMCVSHSLYQAVIVEDGAAYMVDLGDSGSTRGITVNWKDYNYETDILRSSSIGSTKIGWYDALGTSADGVDLYDESWTGIAVGSFQLSENNYLVAASSVDMNEETYTKEFAQNVFLMIGSRISSDSDNYTYSTDVYDYETVWFTDYDEDDGVTAGAPYLVKVSDTEFLLMWEEFAYANGSVKIIGDNVTTKMVLVDENGNKLTDIIETELRLSDCEPIVTDDGYVTWFVTDETYMYFVQVDPYNLEGIDTETAHVHQVTSITIDRGSYSYYSSSSGYVYELLEDYVVTYTTRCRTCDEILDSFTISYTDLIDGYISVEPTTENLGEYTGTLSIDLDGHSLYYNSCTIKFICTGHEWGEAHISLSSSCTEAGYGYYKCSICGTYDWFDIEATGHTAGDPVVIEGEDDEILCTSSGTYVLGTYCEDCGELLYTETIEVEATEHDYEEKVTRKATCTSDGISYYTCTKCGYTRKVITAATGHDYEITDSKEATCTENGYITYTCTVCGDEYTETVSAAGHDYDCTVTEEATCTETGERTYTCSVCGDTYTETISATGHSYQTTIVSPTCTSTGYFSMACTGCGKVIYQIEYGTTAHSYDEGTVTKEATCTENGEITYTCTECGDTYTEAISASGHSYDNGVVTKEATCTEGGVITYTCTECGDTYTEAIPATGHSYDDGVITTAATCTTAGVKTYTCSSCGATKTKTVAKTGHTYSGNVCTACGALKSNSISGAEITLSSTSYTYNGTARKPSVTVTLNGTTLTKDTDYTVTYSSNTKVGTAKVTIKGKGSYSGSTSATFTISKQKLSSSKTSLSYTSKTYTGSALKPSVTVKNSSGTKLTKGTDYTVSYKNNKSAGTATVTITGTGNYTGTITKTFKITKASQTLKVTTATKTLKYSKVKSAKQTVKAITKVSGARGKVTYSKTSGSKYLTVNSSTGKITVKKGTPKGTYKIKVKITSAATSNYKSKSVTKTITIKVK